LPVGVEHYMQMRPGIDVVPSPAVLGHGMMSDDRTPLAAAKARVSAYHILQVDELAPRSRSRWRICDVSRAAHGVEAWFFVPLSVAAGLGQAAPSSSGLERRCLVSRAIKIAKRTIRNRQRTVERGGAGQISTRSGSRYRNAVIRKTRARHHMLDVNC
jgi:hypothetical protein